MVNRGDHSYIDTFPGIELDNPLSGCTADVCPVGALLEKDSIHTTRTWLLRPAPAAQHMPQGDPLQVSQLVRLREFEHGWEVRVRWWRGRLQANRIQVEMEGQTFDVTVPRGVRPGQTFQVEIPTPSQPAARGGRGGASAAAAEPGTPGAAVQAYSAVLSASFQIFLGQFHSLNMLLRITF